MSCPELVEACGHLHRFDPILFRTRTTAVETLLGDFSPDFLMQRSITMACAYHNTMLMPLATPVLSPFDFLI